MTTLAIIGAGLAGLAAARDLRLRHPDLQITVYEKSRGLGGRVATRRRAGYIFDHGAQNIKASGAQVERLLTVELPTDALRKIAPPVWAFDGTGRIAPGDPALNAETKWAYSDGINRLGKLLADGISMRRETRIAALRRPRHGWSLIDTAGQIVGQAYYVLLTAPAPQTGDILAASELETHTRDGLLIALGQASYNRCISLALPYPRLIERPFYALINTDRHHPITWLALEHTKGLERCPPGHSLLLPQMAAQWSLDHWEAPEEELTPLVARLVAELLGEDLGAPEWCDIKRWRFALPTAGVDVATLGRLGQPHGLFFAGDALAGKGRIHLAIESGWQAARQIEQWLPKNAGAAPSV